MTKNPSTYQRTADQRIAGDRHWRKAEKIALAEYACPECEAQPGESCFKLSRVWGKVECAMHSDRKVLGSRPDEER